MRRPPTCRNSRTCSRTSSQFKQGSTHPAGWEFTDAIAENLSWRDCWSSIWTGRANGAQRPVARPTERKPNLLYLFADDHAGYVLRAMETRGPIRRTLTDLASEGTRFAANYCNAPVCTPSRQSILTGQLPHASGVTVLQHSFG